MRLVSELVEFLTPTKKDIKDSEAVGRESGSLAWRETRKEVQAAGTSKGFEWQVNADVIQKFGLNVKFYYDCARDVYFMGNSSNEVKIGWKNGIFREENVFRKEEKDWKMVYLARRGRKNYEHS
jgi:peptide-N4-(N-acetyl-beta-glucosaminyl)asparagine amidase